MWVRVRNKSAKNEKEQKKKRKIYDFYYFFKHFIVNHYNKFVYMSICVYTFIYYDLYSCSYGEYANVLHRNKLYECSDVVFTNGQTLICPTGIPSPFCAFAELSASLQNIALPSPLVGTEYRGIHSRDCHNGIQR